MSNLAKVIISVELTQSLTPATVNEVGDKVVKSLVAAGLKDRTEEILKKGDVPMNVVTVKVDIL